MTLFNSLFARVIFTANSGRIPVKITFTPSNPNDFTDKHFAPTCVFNRQHSYRYDRFDQKYETLKYTHPSECKDFPLANEGLCQKVYKVKITTDLRKYTAPARGSKAWKTLFKRCTAVERVNAYLKEYFQLNNVRYRTGKRAKVHFDLVTLVYNASKLAVDRLAWLFLIS